MCVSEEGGGGGGGEEECVVGLWVCGYVECTLPRTALDHEYCVGGDSCLNHSSP